MLDSGQQERLRSLNSFIVKHPKMTRAIEAIEETKLLSYSAPEPQCLLIMGESGVGKTTLKNIFCDRYPREEKEDGTIVPVLSINIPAPATIGSMVSALLRNLGGPIVSSQSIDERTDRLRKLIVACGVELIILDEFQHFMEGNKKRISQGVSDWLKNLISETNVPIVLIGLPKSENILLADPQLKRRVTNKVNLETFRLGTSFQKFLKTLEGQLRMPETLGWAEKEMVRKFHNATQGNIAHLMNIVRAAAFEAIKQKADTISEDMLARAYEDRITSGSAYGAGGATTNPFGKAESVTKPRQPAKSRPRRTKNQRQRDEAKYRRDLSAAMNPKGGA